MTMNRPFNFDKRRINYFTLILQLILWDRNQLPQKALSPSKVKLEVKRKSWSM